MVHLPGGVGEDADGDRYGVMERDRRVLATDVEVADTTLRRARGVMFRSSLPEDYALVFPFDSPGKRWIHTWLVRVPIDVVWVVDDEVTRVETMRPWLGIGSATADTVVEFAAGGAEGVDPGDVLRVEE